MSYELTIKDETGESKLSLNNRTVEFLKSVSNSGDSVRQGVLHLISPIQGYDNIVEREAIQKFLIEYCKVTKDFNDQIPFKELYDEYLLEGFPAVSKILFSKTICSHGISKGKGYGNVAVCIGVKMK